MTRYDARSPMQLLIAAGALTFTFFAAVVLIEAAQGGTAHQP